MQWLKGVWDNVLYDTAHLSCGNQHYVSAERVVRVGCHLARVTHPTMKSIRHTQGRVPTGHAICPQKASLTFTLMSCASLGKVVSAFGVAIQYKAGNSEKMTLVPAS